MVNPTDYPRLARATVRRTVPAHELEDAVGEAVLALVQRAPSHISHARRIARQAAFEYMARTYGLRSVRPPSFEQLYDTTPAPGSLSDEVEDRERLRGFLAAAADGPDEGAIVALMAALEFTDAEIAVQLGRSERTVLRTRHRLNLS